LCLKYYKIYLTFLMIIGNTRNGLLLHYKRIKQVTLQKRDVKFSVGGMRCFSTILGLIDKDI